MAKTGTGRYQTSLDFSKMPANQKKIVFQMQDTAVDLSRKGMLVDPGDHFKGRYEVERKFRVDGLEHIRSELMQRGAIAFTIGNSETDVFFDLPDKRLAKNNQFHTLRHMTPSDRVLWISKGPAKDECVAMDLTGYDKAEAMLKSLGFEETMRISKKRDIYFIDAFHVTLDDVAGLGTFVELAVMTDDQDQLPVLQQKVRDAAQAFGLTDLFEETRSYRQMLTDIPRDGQRA